jgi:hypothetical protein
MQCSLHVGAERGRDCWRLTRSLCEIVHDRQMNRAGVLQLLRTPSFRRIVIIGHQFVNAD